MRPRIGHWGCGLSLVLVLSFALSARGHELVSYRSPCLPLDSNWCAEISIREERDGEVQGLLRLVPTGWKSWLGLEAAPRPTSLALVMPNCYPPMSPLFGRLEATSRAGTWRVRGLHFAMEGLALLQATWAREKHLEFVVDVPERPHGPWAQ